MLGCRGPTSHKYVKDMVNQSSKHRSILSRPNHLLSFSGGKDHFPLLPWHLCCLSQVTLMGSASPASLHSSSLASGLAPFLAPAGHSRHAHCPSQNTQSSDVDTHAEHDGSDRHSVVWFEANAGWGRHRSMPGGEIRGFQGSVYSVLERALV